jgi:predicted nucleic acid-binding protein
MILVDTSVLIGFFQRHENPSVLKFREILTREIPFGITAQILQEILQGTKTQNDFDRSKAYLETQVFHYPRDPIGSYAQAAQLYRQCRQNGVTPRSTIDCLIAQIAIENNLALLHRDRDFDSMAKIVDLKLY